MKAIGYFCLVFGFLMTVQGTTWQALAMMLFGVALIWGAISIDQK
jgi:membrane-bound ClpP family serine protease